MTDFAEGSIPQGAITVIAHAGEAVVTREQWERFRDNPPTPHK